MKLLWCRYLSNPVSYILILELGRKDDKICCLVPDKLSREQVHLIRASLPQLQQMDLEGRQQWLRDQCPTAMQCYRSYKTSVLQVLREYPIKNLQEPKI
jgi:hypothetical protein